MTMDYEVGDVINNVSDVMYNVTNVTSLHRDVIHGLYRYGIPVMTSLGILGNTASSVVFLVSDLRHQSNSVYLAFLNMADCLFLLTLLVANLEWYNLYPMRMRGVCEVTVYLSYISAFLSVWTVVSFTVERFIVVYFPLKRLEHCTKQRAARIVVALLSLSLLMYNFALWTTHVAENPRTGAPQCSVVKSWESLANVFSVADTVLTLVLPSVLIIVFNVLIVLGVWRFIRQRAALQEGYSGNDVSTHVQYTQDMKSEAVPLSDLPKCANNGTIGQRWSGTSTRNRKCSVSLSSRAQAQALQLRTTRTLLTISTLFVVLNLPSHAFRVWATLHPQGDLPAESLLLLQSAFQYLYYLNFASNLLIYCACMRTFRTEAVKLTCKLFRKITQICK